MVRTADGLSTDARTLAAQIGLAKAMQKYDLRKLITFHSSVAKAARFVDATRRDSLPGVIAHLTRSARPSGKLGTKDKLPVTRCRCPSFWEGPVECLVIANPDPSDRVVLQNSDGSVVPRHSNRPESRIVKQPMEMQTRVLRVGHELLIGVACRTAYRLGEFAVQLLKTRATFGNSELFELQRAGLTGLDLLQTLACK